ncbi:MAG: dehydrogenase, partial [Candidatus Omnitrophica bacterium]|nr:dehydrogenase [Candidatus Omnitrophota bacterium]
VNNVETLATVPHIVSKGADWFRKIGTEKSSGTKLLSISGDCKKPGVCEVEYGISVNEVLKLAEADNVKAVQVGGASGVCLTEGEFERKIAFEDLPTGGSVIIFNKSRKIVDIVKSFLEFFEEESCGQCTPCREGIPVLLEGVGMLEDGTCCEKYLKDLLSLAETMQCSSKCGLGQAAPNAFVDMVNKFKGEYKLSQIPREERSFNA